MCFINECYSFQKDSVQLVTSQKYFTSLIFCPIFIEGNNRLSKMGQRVHFSASCMLTKSCSKAILTATMKSCLTSIIFVMLVSTEATVIHVIFSNDNSSITKSTHPYLFILGLKWNCEELVSRLLINVLSHHVGEAYGAYVLAYWPLKFYNLTKRSLADQMNFQLLSTRREMLLNALKYIFYPGIFIV